MNNSDQVDLMARGQACVDVGNIAEASAIFAKLCEIAPENAEAWLMQGALYGEAGVFEKAETCLNKAIELQPNYPEAFLTLAHLYRGKMAIKSAYKQVKHALEIDAEYDEAWVFLGTICCELNYLEEAKHASKEAIKRWPENPQAHISLSTALCYQGNMAEAETAMRDALELGGQNQPSISALLGRMLIVRGEFDQAEPYIRNALTLSPNDVNVLISRAKIKLGQRHFAQAELELSKIVKIVPENADAWNDLGSAFQMLHKTKEAERCYFKSVELAADALAPVYNLALLLEREGKYSEAVDKLKTAHIHHPENLEVIGLLGGILEKSGKFDEAISVIEPALSRAEKSVRIGATFQRLCKKMQQCAQAMDYLEEVSKTTIINHDDRAAVHFSLGQLYDRQNQYDKAFTHYQQGNTAYNQVYNPDDFSAHVDKIMQVFSALNFAKAPCSTRTEQPIFIVGMPRSGSSLVEQILSSHSQVFGAGELFKLMELTENMTSADGTPLKYPLSVENITQQMVDKLATEYLDFTSNMSGGASHVTDKLPHNFQNVGLIKHLFPNAKIIHCVRDARDTCLSCYFQNFTGVHPYNYDLTHIGRHYVDYQRLMAHWKTLEISILDVHYEKLVDDQEAGSKQLIEYCGLPWEEQCLDFYKSGRATKTASYDQVRQPIYKTSKQRWKNYEKHLSPLFKALEFK